MPPGSSALLLEQRAIVYSLPHWHSKCSLTVRSHNQQVAIFMHVQVEGKLFMGDWTREKRAASRKGGKKKKKKQFCAESFPLSIGHWICQITATYNTFIIQRFQWEKRCPCEIAAGSLDIVMHLRHGCLSGSGWSLIFQMRAKLNKYLGWRKKKVLPQPRRQGFSPLLAVSEGL